MCGILAHMKMTLKIEELGLFLLFSAFFFLMPLDWWWYLVLILAPDVGALGYLVNMRVGAVTYNTLHFRGLGVVLIAVGVPAMTDGSLVMNLEGWSMAIGLIILAHASLDRAFGYGLKYPDSFDHTHLGWIGKSKGKNA